MTRLRIYQIDAFTDRVFRGNPAAVVPLDEWLDDARLQNIAAENNLSETAFFVPQGSDYQIRWFTPVREVALCGHATLASAYVILNLLEPTRSAVRFHSLSGELTVTRSGDLLMLNFPSRFLHPCNPPALVLEGLRQQPAQVLETGQDTKYYAIFDTEADILALRPDLGLLAQLPAYGVAVSAPGSTADFVSRYFAPSYGIPEDPVTGSIHCALVPYWSQRLGKSKLLARQLSQRGGELICEWLGERVMLAGRAVKYLEGEIYF